MGPMPTPLNSVLQQTEVMLLPLVTADRLLCIFCTRSEENDDQIFDSVTRAACLMLSVALAFCSSPLLSGRV